MKLGSIRSCVTALVSGFFLIAAVSECEVANSRNFGMLLDETGVELVPHPVLPQMSPDGSYIMFYDVSRRNSLNFFPTRIFAVSADASRLHRIPDGPSAHEYFTRDLIPDISPDGSRIVYSTFRYSTGMPWNRVHSYEIATAKPDGSDAKRLTRNEYDDKAPVWSPDGRRIAFVSGRDGYPQGMYTMNSDGSDVRRIAPVGGGVPTLVWSPDTRHIALSHSYGGEWDTESNGYIGIVYYVALVGSDGSGYRRVIESDSPISEPSWSPDGRRMAFITTEDKVVTLYTVNVDGSNLQQVVSIPVPELSHIDRRIVKANTTYLTGPYVSWSSDGSEILFYHGYRPGAVALDGNLYSIDYVLYSVRPDGSGFRTLQERITGTAVSVDGSRVIVYAHSEGLDGEVVLYTTALDGSDKRILVRSAYGELVAENSGWREDVPTCSTGDALSDPGGNPGLVQDCETLLSIRDTLSGEGVELNWRAYTPIEDWWGITVGGSPLRVEVLAYPNPVGTELRGTIPPEVGDLTGLKSIWLGGSQLTGPIPSELGDLVFLETLRLSGNRLTGSIPVELGNLENLQELYLHSNNLTGCIPSEIRLSPPNLSVDVGLEPC